MKLFNEMENLSEIQEEINGWTLKPIDKDEASTMELVELSSGYAVEQFQWENYYKSLALTPDKDIQKLYGKIAFQEEEHLSKIGSVADPNMTPMESSITLQMTAIQGLSEAAQLETNKTLKSTFNYILLDHLTHMKMLSDSASRAGSKGNVFEIIMVTLGAGSAVKIKAKPEEITKGTLQIREGRPIEKQFIPMSAIYKQPLNKDMVDVTSFVNAHTILANEMQLRNEYQMYRKMIPSRRAKASKYGNCGREHTYHNARIADGPYDQPFRVCHDQRTDGNKNPPPGNAVREERQRKGCT